MGQTHGLRGSPGPARRAQLACAGAFACQCVGTRAGASFPQRDRCRAATVRSWEIIKSAKFGLVGTSPEAPGRVLKACLTTPYPPTSSVGPFVRERRVRLPVATKAERSPEKAGGGPGHHVFSSLQTASTKCQSRNSLPYWTAFPRSARVWSVPSRLP